MNNTQIYEEITNRILAEMEKGIIPWQRPWTSSTGAVSHTSGRPYSLLNQMLITIGSDNPEIHYGEYLTFNQAKAEGGMVRRGEKGKWIVFWKMYQKEREKEDGTKIVDVIPCLKNYYVFEVSQCDNIERRHKPDERIVPNPVEEAEQVVNTYFDRESCILRVCESNRAYYSPDKDMVSVPQISQYDTVSEYYSTLFHEMTHSTGHPSRLDRIKNESVHFGSEDYSKEELVAEMGAAFMLNHVGIDCQKSFRNSVAYLQCWSRKFREDARLFATAASKAEAAVNYILNGKEGE